ncbi:2-methoxy-6-polyprenyl-1,4-benzoquinol methylase, mitochondrial [Plakobranchus ocellatus]|uniref:2-methoxy-6-polyprenyl-1,4-benzoquinol methylase, mitochondrial n=1 Tax=Plakobranchus ocellatus TaxID=259542 RepID=A0AAV3ZUW1_9GAST|nr:2-methoxy-6-polyprenyl-1,4-benzoquinol methylase, mitochondrial [Plakobranchus ocellatus]
MAAPMSRWIFRSHRTCFRARCLMKQLKIQEAKVERSISSQNVQHEVESSEGNKKSEKETHFGFQSVAEEDKENKVYQVFENVASNYDLMNDAMSAGIHRIWKDMFLEKFSPSPGTKLLDVAGGTGDIAFRFLKRVGTPNYGEVIDDIEMPRDVTAQVLHLSGLSWVRGNAECLPLPDNAFDAYTIAFGIRNCTHVQEVLNEAYRVLKPGGRFMCLEFSEVKNPLLRSAYDAYSFQVIPVMGQLIAGDWKSYQYLVESIRQFPNQEDFAAMIKSAGFRMVSYQNLTFGVAAIHSGYKI